MEQELGDGKLLDLRGRSDNVATLASTDRDLLSLWLRAKASRNVNTLDSYRREGNRLLVWLESEGLTLREMMVEHVHQFFDLLRDPPAFWIRPRKLKKNQVTLTTQLMFKGLDERAVSHTRSVIAQFFTYGQDVGYLRFNVFKLSEKPMVSDSLVQDKFLDMRSWRWLWTWAQEQAKDEVSKGKRKAVAARNRWLLALSYFTGLRRHEIAGAKFDDFIKIDDVVFLKVLGKGGKRRSVTINSVLLEELEIYKSFLRLEKIAATEATPLIVPLYGKVECMTPRSIGKIFEQISAESAEVCSDEDIKKRLLTFTPHQMRHTTGTHRYLAECFTESTQIEFGHSDSKTTQIYQKVLPAQRLIDAEKLAALFKE